jgi:HPt (histidine-containing phosphotransfer) domain-containing protein
MFLKHVPEQLTAIGRAIEDGDVAAVKAASHKLKGSCLAVGIPRMAALCAQLEDGSGDQRALFQELASAFERARGELGRPSGSGLQASGEN